MTSAEFKRAREAMGMSRAQLAAALGLANSRQIQRIENGSIITGPMGLAMQHLLQNAEKSK